MLKGQSQWLMVCNKNRLVRKDHELLFRGNGYVYNQSIESLTNHKHHMKPYYIEEDLDKFGSIREFQPDLGDKFFEYYNSVFKEGALTEREKSLIALAVAHAVQCPAGRRPPTASSGACPAPSRPRL